MVGREAVSMRQAGLETPRYKGLGGWGPHGRVSAGSDMAGFAVRGAL